MNLYENQRWNQVLRKEAFPALHAAPVINNILNSKDKSVAYKN